MGAEPMIEVTGAWKSFAPQTPVLKDLNMTVQQKTIYGLLGPSGCGKTTLLGCILGMTQFDVGTIKLGILERRQVGYMPQEVALFKEFTIREIFIFYGKMFGMSEKSIEARSKELQDLLFLPNWKKTIGSLSGGEQRRVSFCVALLHDPQLLILDEPTVGVDTVLSNSMWQYLFELATKEGKTILVTTHYVEEARQAHTIGLMRGGVLLYEGSPANVMAQENTLTLEKAFLEISKRQEAQTLTPNKDLKALKHLQQTELPLKRKELFNKNRFTAQLIKNVCWVKRNTMIMTFLLLLPAMQSFLYCASFGQDPLNLTVGFISDELKGKDCSMFPQVPLKETCEGRQPFTCRYLSRLKKTMNIEMYKSPKFAKESVTRNRIWGYIHISSNFTDALNIRYGVKEINESPNYLEEINNAVEMSTVNVQMDMSNYVIANQLVQQITTALSTFVEDHFHACNVSVPRTIVKFMDPVFGSNHPVYAHSGLPGFFCSFCFYFTMIFTSGAIMMEKLVGLLERSMVAGMTYLEVVGAHLVVQFVLMSAQKTIMLLVFYGVYTNPFYGQLFLVVILLFAIEFVGISYGFLLTEIFASDRLVSYAGIGATLAVFSLGGIIWPLEGAHALIKSWVWAFPVVPAVESYNSITSRGYGIAEPSVYWGFISCTLWTLLFTLGTFLVAKSKKTS